MIHEHFDRITQDPAVMGGKACIRGMRLTVGTILSQIGAGETIDELLVDYPYLEKEDVLQSLQYAAWLAQTGVSLINADDGSLAYLFRDYIDDGIREPIVDFGDPVGNEQW